MKKKRAKKLQSDILRYLKEQREKDLSDSNKQGGTRRQDEGEKSDK